MFIGACAQINVCENVFVCVSAFVMKKSYFGEHLVGGVTQQPRFVIGLFVWLIEARCCVIKYVLNKHTCG